MPGLVFDSAAIIDRVGVVIVDGASPRNHNVITDLDFTPRNKLSIAADVDAITDSDKALFAFKKSLVKKNAIVATKPTSFRAARKSTAKEFPSRDLPIRICG
jgi:hypothetical protein